MSTYILKIGTFITPENDASSIGLLTQEPKNFASFLSKYFDDNIVFCSNVNDVKVYNKLDNVHFANTVDEYSAEFIDITSNNYAHIFSKITQEDKLIIWQGMKPGLEIDNSMYYAYKFINAWQTLELNNVFFVMTDTRVQFLNLYEYFKRQQYEVYRELIVDTSSITLLTQAANLNAFSLMLKNMSFNVNVDYDKDLYFKDFKSIKHIALHYLPLFSHYLHTANTTKEFKSVFMTQCINYLDDYRLKCLASLICDIKSKYCAGVHVFSKPVEHDKLLAIATQCYRTFIAPTMHNPVHFTETKQILSKSVYSICVAEHDYVKCDLLPNRIFEAIAAKCVPIIHNDILVNTKCLMLNTDYIYNINKHTDLANIGLNELISNLKLVLK